MLLKITASIAAGVVLFLLGAVSAFSQPPDPRDSIILESKTVAPGAYPGPSSDAAAYLYVRVFITNKDSLSWMTLPLLETSTSGGAYAILGRPRTFLGMVSPLTNTLRFDGYISYGQYDSKSPDIFMIAAGFDPTNPTTIEPPNATRRAIWELKFDSVWAMPGTFELDSTQVGSSHASFTTSAPLDLKVNFLKGVITVAIPPKGDLNLDFTLTSADVVLMLNCTFCSDCPPPPAGTTACDLNCDGLSSPADVVLELYAVFLFRPFPC